jgi:hypothetical protein
MIQDQFGRFLYWLNQGQNAAAVQAVAALATTFLTVVLLWATIRYVRLTNLLAIATRAQLEAGLRPNLRFDVTRTLDAETGVKISNVGQIPVRLGLRPRERFAIVRQIQFVEAIRSGDLEFRPGVEGPVDDIALPQVELDQRADMQE